MAGESLLISSALSRERRAQDTGDVLVVGDVTMA
jgi:hypothetical protein